MNIQNNILKYCYDFRSDGRKYEFDDIEDSFAIESCKVTGLAISSNNTYPHTLSYLNSLQIYYLQSGELKDQHYKIGEDEYEYDSLMITKLKFTKNCKYLLSISNWDPTLRIWHVPINKEEMFLQLLCQMTIDFEPIHDINFDVSDDNEHFVLANCKERSIQLFHLPPSNDDRNYNPRDGNIIRFFNDDRNGYSFFNSFASFSSDSKKIICLSDHGVLRVLDVNNLSIVKECKIIDCNGTTGITSFNLDNSRDILYATFLREEKVITYDINNDEITSEISYEGLDTAFAFSSDNSIIVTSTRYGVLKIWDVKTGSKLHTIQDHSGHVESIAFSPDNTCFVSASEDGTFNVYDTLQLMAFLSWKEVGDIVMLRWLYNNERATIKEEEDDNNNLQNSCGNLQIVKLIIQDAPDIIFHHMISYLVHPLMRKLLHRQKRQKTEQQQQNTYKKRKVD